MGELLGISRSTSRKLVRVAAARYTDHPKEMKPEDIVKLMQGRGNREDLERSHRQRAEFPLKDPTNQAGDFIAPDAVEPVLAKQDLPNKYAQRAWDEFGYFRVRYYNRRNIPWQLEMVQVLMAWIEEGQRVQDTIDAEVVKGILNTPPGGGKTTTVTHDFPSWLISRNRDIRTALGARTIGQSEKYTRRLRTTLERNVLLNMEFGRFKPLQPETWRKDEFIVDGVTGHKASTAYKLALAGLDPHSPEVRARLEDENDPIHEMLRALEDVFMTGEKEATVMALSQEMGFLGGRFDLVLWDDLCDAKNSSTAPQLEDTLTWWDSEAESRAEPGGFIGLIGTRFGKFDLYKHKKDLTYTVEEEADELLLQSATGAMTEEELQAIREDIEKELVDRHGYEYATLHTPDKGTLKRSRRVWRYYKFPAHDASACESPASLKNSNHISCVLDPQRFSFRHLMKMQASNPRRFKITYQQEDGETIDNLVQTVWLTGGVDNNNLVVPGCYDYGRKLLETPQFLKEQPYTYYSNLYSVATVDPSAQNYWAIQWWIWDKAEDKDYLMNTLRHRLQAGHLLDNNLARQSYDGIMHEWQIASTLAGFPIGLWIIEANAAQKFLFQYKWVQEWMKEHRTLIMGHSTGANKSNEEYGVQTLGPRYRQGLVNLPFSQDDLRTRVSVSEMTREFVQYPEGATDDQVMAHWFLNWNRYKFMTSMSVAHARKPMEHPNRDTMPERLTRPMNNRQVISAAEAVRRL